MPSRIIGKIDLRNYNLNKDIELLNSVTQQPEEYDEFGQGYWKNLSIYNASGDAADTQYRTTDHCLPTEHALLLCLDFMSEDAFIDTDIFVAQAAVDVDCHTAYINRQPLHKTHVTEIISATSKIINRHTFKDIVFALSKYHFIYDIPVSSCYDWIISAARQTNNLEIIDKAVGLRRYLIEQRDIGQRYTINDWSA